MKDEIYEIPFRAELCYKKNKGLILPENVPYIGMGASNIASKTFRYLGIDIYPEKAAEYFNYLTKYKRPGNGVLISQSGQSSETLWCADYFESYTAVINNPDSPLGKHKNCSNRVMLYSGDEHNIVTKTYINTLLIMYLGFGFDPIGAIKVLKDRIPNFEKLGVQLGEIIRSKLRWKRHAAIYVLGNGPNIATANLAALVLSNVTKVPISFMSVSQYDHGFKETAKNTLVIGINHEGPEYSRTKKLLKTVENAGAQVFELNNPVVDSVYSPLTFPLPFYFAAEYLANKLKVKSVFHVGDKITRVDSADSKTE